MKTLSFRTDVEQIDNGFIVTMGTTPTSSDPMGQRGPLARKYYLTPGEVCDHIRDAVFFEMGL